MASVLNGEWDGTNLDGHFTGVLQTHCSPGRGTVEGSQSSEPRPKEINPEYSLEGMMLKMKMKMILGRLVGRADSLERS